jgi:hypothetical protein
METTTGLSPTGSNSTFSEDAILGGAELLRCELEGRGFGGCESRDGGEGECELTLTAGSSRQTDRTDTLPGVLVGASAHNNTHRVACVRGECAACGSGAEMESELGGEGRNGFG